MMKNLLFVIALLGAQNLLSQTWSQADEANIGESAQYYLIDSTISTYSTTIGANSNWDYSNVSTYSFDKLYDAKADDATLSTYANFFPTSTHDEYFNDAVHIFYNYVGNQRLAYGMQLYEPSQGDFLVLYDSFPERTYPIGLNNTFGTSLNNVEVVIYPNSTSPAERRFEAQAGYYARCEGTGTLTIGDSTFTNVLRYYRRDSVGATLGILGAAKLLRKQYEYLLPGRTFPIFIHTSLKITGAFPVKFEYVQVLSQVKPKISTGINESFIKDLGIQLFPNPAHEVLTISAPDQLMVAQVDIHDLTGKRIASQSISPSGNIAIDDLPEGVYSAIIVLEDGRSTAIRFVKVKHQ